MTDKMREEFETAVALEAKEPVLAVYLSRRDDTYSTSTLHFAWWAWKQSREALVIELPQIVGYEAGYDSIRENEYASQSSELFDADEVFALCRSIEVREAIEAAGVKVKS